MQLDRSIESSLCRGAERISNSQRIWARGCIALCSERRVAKDSGRNIESQPIKYVRFDDAGLRNNWIRFRDGRSREGQLSVLVPLQ